MTVSELIKILRRSPQGAIVLVDGYECGMDYPESVIVVEAMRCTADPEIDDHPGFFGEWSSDRESACVCGAPLGPPTQAVLISRKSVSGVGRST